MNCSNWTAICTLKGRFGETLGPLAINTRSRRELRQEN